jgi:hypothetical protein
MATPEQARGFIKDIAPVICEVAKERGYQVVSPIIAQACCESPRFVRDQGGGDSLFKVEMAFSTDSKYTNEMHLGAYTSNWNSVSLGTYIYACQSAGTLNVFVKHTASNSHTIDAIIDYVNIGG